MKKSKTVVSTAHIAIFGNDTGLLHRGQVLRVMGILRFASVFGMFIVGLAVALTHLQYPTRHTAIVVMVGKYRNGENENRRNERVKYASVFLHAANVEIFFATGLQIHK